MAGDEMAGALSQRVLIQRWQGARDGTADDVGQWQAVETVFAAVAPDGDPRAAAAGEAARSGRRWRVTLRDRDDLDLSVRLIWRDQILAVRAVDRAPLARGMAHLWCDGRPA